MAADRHTDARDHNTFCVIYTTHAKCNKRIQIREKTLSGVTVTVLSSYRNVVGKNGGDQAWIEVDVDLL